MIRDKYLQKELGLSFCVARNEVWHTALEKLGITDLRSTL
jgi:hypothetical protein